MPRKTQPSRDYGTSRDYGSAICKAALARSEACMQQASYAFALGSIESLISELAIMHPECRITLEAYIKRSQAAPSTEH